MIHFTDIQVSIIVLFDDLILSWDKPSVTTYSCRLNKAKEKESERDSKKEEEWKGRQV